MPSLIDVGVTPRDEAVRAAGAPDVSGAPDVAVGAGAAVVGAAAFFAPLPHAASVDATTTRTATSGAPRKRPIIFPLGARPPAHVGAASRVATRAGLRWPALDRSAGHAENVMFIVATSVGLADPAFATEIRHFCAALQTMLFDPKG